MVQSKLEVTVDSRYFHSLNNFQKAATYIMISNGGQIFVQFAFS